MKKIYLSFLLSIVTAVTMAQLQNNSFENWNSTSYDEPVDWETGNHESASIGLSPVTKVAGTNGYAVRMQTMVSNSGDTAQAYIANGDPGQATGGIPISGQPTAITGFYRYDLPNNDTALLLVIFKTNGVAFSMNVFKIKGTGTQNTFTAFSFPISLNAMPDSVIIAAAASNLLDNVGVENGSFLELDGIAFTGINSPINNSDFENWSTHSIDNIANWETYGDGVARTTDSHDGTYAISLTTIDYGNGNLSAAGMTSGQNTQNGPIGGTPFTAQVDTVCGWYKYSSPCSDSAVGSVSTQASGINIGGNQTRFGPASQYTYFEIPVYSNTAPDMIRIDFSSSGWPYTNACDGSTLILDQIAMKSELLASIHKIENRKSPFAYPNPTINWIHLNGGKKYSEETTIEIYDLSGRMVMREDKKENSDDAINISILQSGRYYYRQASSRGDSMNSFIKQ